MKLIKPSFEIYEQGPGLEGIYEMIELAGRTCYKSIRPEGKTAKDFVDRMIASKHHGMLEHGTVYLAIPMTTYAPEAVNTYIYNPYSKVNECHDFIFTDKYGNKVCAWCVTTNLRVLVENDCLEDLEFLCEPTKFHEKRVTIKFTTSNSIMREFTRHRSHSFAVESTRYCNYSKDKFNNEITFIAPYWVDNVSLDNVDNYLHGQEYEISFGTITLVNALSHSESCYLSLIKDGAKPQEAREILPLATKCDMIMTGFVSDWEHFFSLRTSIIAETGMPHPDASALADPLYKEFIKRSYLKRTIV